MSDVPEFFQRYRTVFSSFDRDALIDLYTYPVHVVSATDDAPMVMAFTRDEWAGVLDGLLNAYRKIGIVDGDPQNLDCKEIASDAATVRLRWHLTREDGSHVYDIAAGYTLAKLDGDWRVAALAHDELPKLTAALGGDLSGW